MLPLLERRSKDLIAPFVKACVPNKTGGRYHDDETGRPCSPHKKPGKAPGGEGGRARGRMAAAGGGGGGGGSAKNVNTVKNSVKVIVHNSRRGRKKNTDWMNFISKAKRWGMKWGKLGLIAGSLIALGTGATVVLQNSDNPAANKIKDLLKAAGDFLSRIGEGPGDAGFRTSKNPTGRRRSEQEIREENARLKKRERDRKYRQRQREERKQRRGEGD